MKIDKCPQCKSSNIAYNSDYNIWYCNDCNAIWYEYNQDFGGTIPHGKPETSPNKSMPRESSSDKSSIVES